MPRIIAGSARGRQIAAPAGRSTRPTADRVKEALFSALDAESAISGKRILDLYAGSGALGLEAASRGAAAVVFVENDRRALQTLRANVDAVEVAAMTDIVGASVEAWLARPPARGYEFDVALLDPPYAMDVSAVLGSLRDNGWLAEAASIVVERSARDGAFAWPEGFTGSRERRYGEVKLCYGRRA